MATYDTTVQTARQQDWVFNYLATFSNAAEWDPGVTRASVETSGPIGLGSRFSLVVPLLGVPVRYGYEIVEFDPPSRVVLEAKTALLTSRDTITVEPVGSGAVVGYHAELHLRGVLRACGIFLDRAFVRIGDRAASGLRSALA